MVIVGLLAAIKEKQLHKTKIAQKISRFQSTLPYLSSEYRNRWQSLLRPRYQSFSREFLRFYINFSISNLT